MSAAIFGNVSSIMLRLYQGTEAYHERCNSLRDFVRFHRIPPSLASRLVEAHNEMWYRTNGVDMKSILNCFPETLQADICLHLNQRLLIDCSAFHSASPGCLRLLSTKLKSLSAPPGDTLLNQGDIIRSLFFIAKGNVEIAKDGVVVAVIGKNDAFGEDPQQTYRRHQVNDVSSFKSGYSARALTYCDYHELLIEDLMRVFSLYPEFAVEFLRKFTVAVNLRPEVSDKKERLPGCNTQTDISHTTDRQTSVSFNVETLKKHLDDELASENFKIWKSCSGRASFSVEEECLERASNQETTVPSVKTPLMPTTAEAATPTTTIANKNMSSTWAYNKKSTSSSEDNVAMTSSDETNSGPPSTFVVNSLLSSCSDFGDVIEEIETTTPHSDAPSLQWDNTGMDMASSGSGGGGGLEHEVEGRSVSSQSHPTDERNRHTTNEQSLRVSCNEQPHEGNDSSVVTVNQHQDFTSGREISSPTSMNFRSLASTPHSSCSSTVLASTSSLGLSKPEIKLIDGTVSSLSLSKMDRQLADITERVRIVEDQLTTAIEVILNALKSAQLDMQP